VLTKPRAPLPLTCPANVPEVWARPLASSLAPMRLPVALAESRSTAPAAIAWTANPGSGSDPLPVVQLNGLDMPFDHADRKDDAIARSLELAAHEGQDIAVIAIPGL